MSSSAWPDELGLVPPRREQRADARATLFRLHAELFVNAPARDAETIRSFEALAQGFMPRLDLLSLAAVARLLAPCEDTPAPVLAYLVQRSIETRALVLALAPRIPSLVADLLIGEGPAGAAELAAHPGLDPHTQERLTAMDDPAVDQVLADNTSVALTEPVRRMLLARAAVIPKIGRALLTRPDLVMADEASLYCAADPSRRMLICERIEASPLFQRPSLPSSLSEAEADALLQRAQAGNVRGFEADLDTALGLGLDTPWHLLRPERRDLLAFALAALGLDEARAVRIFLALHPSISHSVRVVFDLTAAFRIVAPATALVLLEAVLDRSVTRGGSRPATTRLVTVETNVVPALGAVKRLPAPVDAEPQRLAS